mgnify:CR=1 FL=1
MNSSTESFDTVARNRRRAAIVLFCVAIFLFWAGLYVYVPTLPVYAKERGASLALVGLIISSYGFTQAVLRIPLGLASDRYGRRKPFVLAGFAVTGISCLILAWAPSPEWLLLGRGLAGVAASSWVASTVLFASYFAPGQALRATSIVTFVSAGAQMVATGAGGRIADVAGWLAPFYAGGLIALVGALAFAGTVEHVVVRRPATWGTLRRLGTHGPLLGASAVAAIGKYVAQSTTHGFVPIHAKAAFQASSTALGDLATLTQLAYTLAALVSAAVARRLRIRRALTVGLVMVGLSTALVPLAPSFLVLEMVRVLFGAGYGLIYPVAMGLAIRDVPAEERASAMGIFQAVYAVGMFAGPAISGWLAAGVGLQGMFWLTSLLPLGTAGVAGWLSRRAHLRVVSPAATGGDSG